MLETCCRNENNHMDMKKTIIFSALLLLGGSTFAQFRLSAEFRPRTEYSHGYATLADMDQKPSLFTSQRTRLNFEFKASGIQTKLVLQDVRIWGSQAQQNLNEDFAVSIHEAWGEVNFSPSLSLRLGRQELVYDNSRILGNSAWNQQARSHDLALLKYKGYVDVHLGVAYNESGDRKNNIYSGPNAYKFMQFLWINKNFDDLKVSLLGINDGRPVNTTDENSDIISQKTVFTQTVGPWFEYKLGKLLLTGNAYYQAGKLVNGKDLSAYEYLFETSWRPAGDLLLGAGFEELSGTDQAAAVNTAHSFNPLYATGHKFNGHMDYFYAGNHLGSVGLRDLYARIGYKVKGVDLGLDIHKFWAQSDLELTTQKDLGYEFDFYAGYKLNESVELNLGYSHLLATETLELLKGGHADGTQNWAWVMFTFKPEIIK